MMKEGISLEDLLITLSERLLSDIKSLKAGRMEGEPYMEISETPGKVRLTAELCNAAPGDVKVVAGRNQVDLLITKKGLERFRGSYSVPEIRPGSIEIRFKNGVLEITAEKGIRNQPPAEGR